jgi:hypothetical protein
MRRALIISILLAVALPPAQAQMRGAAPRPAMRGAAPSGVRIVTTPAPTIQPGFAPSVGFAPRDPFVWTNRCDPFVFRCGPPLTQQLIKPHRRFNTPFFFTPVFGGGGIPIFWDYSQPDYPPQAVQPAPQPIIIYANPPAPVATEERVPEEHAASAPASEPIELPTTILVFRDQHREDIKNYAIVGDTLYVFLPDGLRKKVALSDLDLSETIKVNDDRGVDFRVPAIKGG